MWKIYDHSELYLTLKINADNMENNESSDNKKVKISWVKKQILWDVLFYNNYKGYFQQAILSKGIQNVRAQC